MDQSKANNNENKNSTFLSRRDVLVALGSLGLVTGLTGLLRETMRFLIPPISQIRPSTLIAGLPTEFPSGELTPLAEGPVFIGRDEAGLFALSAVCTHLGCTVARSGEGLTCPCHGSRFAFDGANLTGPAARPLPYLALQFNDDGLVEVDLNQVVESAFRLKPTSG
ncbi:MAG: Rieske 2Fe-2S domain-containing protein [Anaerolineae bacterium]|nr:Rieske 2Fe-2S domain-containing protein [Anaerolineae bacterium]